MPSRSKSSLSLYKTKRSKKRKLFSPPPSIRKKKFKSQLQTGKQHEPMFISPTKSPSWKMVISPAISESVSIMRHELKSPFSKISGSPAKARNGTPKRQKSRKKLEFADRNKSLEPAAHTNIQADLDETINLLNQLVSQGKFSVHNIGYKIFKDTLKWHSSSNISGMRYSQETKEFFWTGERLLGGQFLRFMRGFAHKGCLKQNQTEKGMYAPCDTSINFPVPSRSSLFDFKPQQMISERSPGIMTENIRLYAEQFQNRSNVIMFDGKKIVPQSAEVFLLDKEEEPKISTLKAEYNDKLVCISNFIEYLENLQMKDIQAEELSELNEKCKHVLKLLGTTIKVLRETVAKKALYLKTLEKKLLETNDQKFSFAINKVKTLMYRLKVCTKDILTVIDDLAMFSAKCNGVFHLYRREICDLTRQANYRELKLPGEVMMDDGTEVPTYFVKQRTPEWFSLRSTVKVTGSVIHQAIGMDTLANQKRYFDQIIGGKPAKDVSDDQRKAMEHGSLNEENAVATLVGKILPVYFPDYVFFEEGAYEVQSSDGRRLLVISPDGSIRNGENIVSIEIKCPYSMHPGATPVYYDVKFRHMLQNLFEANVLQSHHHLYISWSNESTTVFRVMRNDDITSAAVEQVEKTYYGEIPVCPNRTTEDVKALRESLKESSRQAEFLGEFASLTAVKSTNTNLPTPGPYLLPVCSSQNNDDIELCLTDTIQALFKAHKHMKEAYEFQKPMASEVLVYLLSDMDRTWKKELGHGLPISYLFKGYSLSMNTARALLDEMLNACSNEGVHIPCTTFDGQFSRLKDFDNQDQVLTLFALQRKHWSAVHKLSKTELIHEIKNCYKYPNWYKVNDIVVENDIMLVKPGYIVLENSLDVPPIQTPTITKLLTVNRTSNSTNVITEDVPSLIDAIPTAAVELNAIDELDVISEEVSPSLDALSHAAIQLNEVDNSNLILEEVSTSNESLSNATIELNDENFEVIRKQLCSGKKKTKWLQYSVSDIRSIFQSATKINNEMTGQELHEIVNYLNILIRSKNEPPIKQSLRKAQKVNKICDVLGRKSSVVVPPKRCRTKTACSLASLCISELQKQSYPKEACEVAYAKISWPTCRKNWFDQSTVAPTVKISVSNNSRKESDEDDELSFSPVYSPEYVAERDQQEVRVMDGTHIRTNIKSKLIRSGLADIKVAPWKKVAYSGKTYLAPAMVEAPKDGKIMHQQSDAYVRTMFCEEVEDELVANGDIKEAKFCRLFREWHEAEDMPGLKAVERCKRSLRLKEWLLDGYEFDSFPPTSMYIKGIPRVTYEGLLCSIDAHLLLYALVKGSCYNWRTVSTLVAENFMGEIAERSPNSHGVPSGITLPLEMAKISELHSMRMKPDRSFIMSTAKSRAYEVQPLQQATVGMNSENIRGSCVNSNNKITEICLRDHEFDLRQQKKGKMGKIHKSHEVPRGVQSVRSNYRYDESKAKPSLLDAIPDDELALI